MRGQLGKRQRLGDSTATHLGDHDPPEGIGDARIDADEVELERCRAERVDLDAEVGAEVVEVPVVALARVVTGEVCRGDLQEHTSAGALRPGQFVDG